MSRRRNGDVVEQKERLTNTQAEEERKTAAAKAGLQDASQREEWSRKKAEYLERLTQTGMSDAGIRMLDNMLDRGWMLGNISEAEHHDIKWWLRCVFIKIRAEFPRADSGVSGDVRAFVLDDRDENLTPLTGQQRIIIGQMVRGLAVLASRSIDGFQQEMLVKSISVSEVVDDDDSEDSLKMGLFN